MVMTWTQLQGELSNITPANQRAMEEARGRWDAIAKPLHGLGRLEELVVQAAGAAGTPELEFARKGVAVFCADNGVVEEGVTQTGQEVTLAVARAMGAGTSSVCRMARTAGAQVFPVDVGMAGHGPVEGLLSQVVMEGGTWNMTRGPAMPRRAAEQAIETGFSLAETLAAEGFSLLAAGEMGIGNTTTTAAAACVFLGRSPEELVGRGAGLSDRGLERKRRAVETALAVNRPDPTDPVDVLSKVGGLDIAAMTGFYLGCAARSVPVILDGAISAAAAVAAVRLCPNARKALLPSHLPWEFCGRALLAELGLEPLLNGRFRLGEGTGAVALMPLLDMALSVYREMTTFGGMGIGAYRPDGEAVPSRPEGERQP